MSRSTLYLIGALLLGIGGFLFWGRQSAVIVPVPPGTFTTGAPTETPSPGPVPVEVLTPLPPQQTNAPLTINAITPVPPDPEAATKIAELEKQYFAANTQEARQDIINGLREISSAETVKSLARLFETEKDTTLQIDLVDVLQSIIGFKEEKLVFLTAGIRAGLKQDVRQAAIDGLIDLEDRRSIAVLKTLEKDEDETIRESARNAIIILESPLTPPLTIP